MIFRARVMHTGTPTGSPGRAVSRNSDRVRRDPDIFTGFAPQIDIKPWFVRNIS